MRLVSVLLLTHTLLLHACSLHVRTLIDTPLSPFRGPVIGLSVFLVNESGLAYA